MAKGFKYAKLVLDEPRAVYYAGQVLSGHLECELEKPIDYTAITVNFNGQATVHWTEDDTEVYNGIYRKVKVDYKGHELYFDVSKCVAGGTGVVHVPIGFHKVPFEFHIPPTVPSTFTGKRGKVNYLVTAYIDYPDPSMERDELYKEFEVVAPLDLNLCDDVKPPVELELESFYSCCCYSSPITVTVSLPGSGYCPGQTIPVHVKVDNQASVEVKKINFQLLKRQRYHSEQPRSEYIEPEEVLVQAKSKGVLSHSKREFTVDLRVPDMIAPNLRNCKIIDIGFFLKVKVEVTGWNDDYEDETELIFGLVPLANLVQNYVHPMQSDLPTAPIPQINPNLIHTTIVNTVNTSPYATINVTHSNTPNINIQFENRIPPFPHDDDMMAPSTNDIGFVCNFTSSNFSNSFTTGSTGVVNVKYSRYSVNSNTSPSAPPLD